MYSWEKRCAKCGETKPYYYFCRKTYRVDPVLTIDHFTDICRRCSAPKRMERSEEQEAMLVFRKTPLYHLCMNYWGHVCAICGRQKGHGLLLAMDHWLPFADGNLISPLNVIPLCQGKNGCNNSKRNRESRAWLSYWIGDEKARVKYAEIEGYFAWISKLEAAGSLRHP